MPAADDSQQTGSDEVLISGPTTDPRLPILNGSFLSTYDPRRATPRVRLPRSSDDAARPEPGASPSVGEQSIILEISPRMDTPGARPELILDESNLLPFSFLRKGDQIGRAVVKIERGDGAAGTAFLIAPEIILTNHHVLPDVATASKARAFANYERDPSPDPAGRPAEVPLDPDTLFVTNPELDFTFCAVSGLSYLGTVPLERNSFSILPSEYVNIIQHPGGRPKEVALQDSQVVKVDNVVVHYCCDTEPGSSGSPVFNNQWRLVAMHHASVATESPHGRSVAGARCGAGYLNEGVRLSAIALWLDTIEASAPPMRSQCGRLRRLFRDLDYQVGFFGALGHKAAGRTAAELVIDSYLTSNGDLDIGFWNLGALSGRLRDHHADLGWALAGLGLDLWCLTGVSDEEVRGLCQHLDASFQLDYKFLIRPAVGDRLGPALLVRRSSTSNIEWLPPSDPDDTMPRALVQAPLIAIGPQARRLVLAFAPRDRRPPGFDLADAALRDRRGCNQADVLLIGDGLRARDLKSLARVGTGLRVALGNDGGLAFIPGPAGRPGPMFVSPNLDLTLAAESELVVTYDRPWPEALDRLGVPLPIATRLILASTGEP
jgi:hypothetical protein